MNPLHDDQIIDTRRHVSNPPMSILDREFVYTPSVSTNVVQLFKRHGWTPPSEEKERA